jgi:hypothetical protein
MTTALYTKLAATASRLMGIYGRSVTFYRYAPSIVGSTGTTTKGAATNTSTASAVVLPASKGTVEAFDNRLENGSLVGRELRYIKVAAASITFEPKSLDEMSMDGSTWEVLGCTPVNPAGTPLVYGVGVAKI